MLMTTYAVGELSALNGVMGAKAERSCVFHLVGMPTMRKQRVRKIIHHTLGDGEFQNFANISAQAACVSAVITPDNCAHEMERLIATARAESRPAYILVASDYAVTPVTATDATPYPKPASGPDLAKAVAAIAERIEAARSLAVLPAYTVSRFKLQDSLRALDRGAGLPVRRDGDGQGGPVRGASPVRRDRIRGPLRPPPSARRSRVRTWSSTPAASASTRSTRRPTRAGISPEKLVTIDVDHVRIGDRIYNPVRMGDVFEMLAGSVRRTSDTRHRPGRRRRNQAASRTTRSPRRTLYPRYRDFLKPRDQIVLESGSSTSGIVPLPLPDGAEVQLPAPLGLDRLGHRGDAGDRARRSDRDGPCSSPARARTRPEPSVIYSPPGKISQKKLENPAGFWNNVGENTSSLFQNKGAFE